MNYSAKNLSLSKSLFRSFCFLLGSSLAIAGAAGQTSVIAPGTTSVGQSQSLVVTVTMTGRGVASAPAAETQGITNADFSVVAGGTCAVNNTYNVGDRCTVAVTFAPKYPGQRLGAVVLKTSDNMLLGETLITANASGALALLVPGRIDTVVGSGDWIFHGDGVPAVAAPIFLPTGVVADAAGNLYLSDSNNNRLRRVDAQTGLISTVAGNGTPGYSGDGALATDAMISAPAGLILDGAGNIYFADSGNHIIRRVDAVSGIITTIAGVPDVQGYAGDGAAATAAKLTLPQGIAFDTAGNLYIADTGNNVIRAVNVTTGIIRTIAGTGVAGSNGDNTPAITTMLNQPWGIAIGPDGLVYVADLNNNRVRKINTAGIISTVAGTGARGFAGDGSSATTAELNEPAAMAFDPAGNLYIADSGNNRVRKVNSGDGTIQTIVGTNSEQFAGDAGAANLASLYGPYALYFDQVGNLFIADMFHNRIRAVSAAASALQYATIRVSKTSAPQAQGVENDGNAILNLTAPVLNNAALDPATTTCTATSVIAVAASCNLGIEFAPTVVGDSVTGSVSLKSSAGNSPAVVSLTGQVLSVEPTSLNLASSINPSAANAPVTFTAKIVSSGSPTGTVTFLDGTAQLCSVALSASGSAICQIATLSLGQHSITASYDGDANDASSVSLPLLQVVKQAPSLALTASPNPATVSNNVTMTATATAATGTPTGSVIFYDGTTALGNATLNASGVATFSTTSLTAATHSLIASYAGDSTNSSAQSNTVTEVVQLATTQVMLATSNASVAVGTSVTYTATIIPLTGLTPTGSVQFLEGTTVLGSGVVGANSNATLTLSTLTPGSHKIVATYAGDTSNATSSSTPLIETVQQIATTTAVTSTATQANAGASVQLTATVAMAAGSVADGTITGQVTFTDGSTTLGMATVDANGSAVLTLATLPVGQHTIVATYNGNTNYAASTSSSLVLGVSQTSTTTGLGTDNPNSLSGKPTVFTATVKSATGVPTGAVAFRDNANNLGQGTLNGQGVATLSVSTLQAGSHSVVAVYAGDTNYVTSTSSPVVQTVALGTISLTLTGPVSPVAAGTAVSVSGTLISNGVTPTGALTLSDGGAVIATQNAATNGSYSFSTSTLALGTHTLLVAYAGDTNNAATTSNAITIVVQQAATTTSLTTSDNPSNLGQSVTLKAGVTSVSPNLTGSVTFLDGSTTLGSVSLVSGLATFTTSSITFGSHNLTAVYSGDTNHATSTAAAIAEQIVQPATATLGSSANPSVSGTTVTFNVKIASVGSIVPTGQITFSDGTTILATMNLDGTGTATYQTSTLVVGSHSISASYAGDKNYSVASATLTQTVQSANTQVALTASANPAIYGTPLNLVAATTSNGGAATGSVSFSDNGVAIGTALLDANGVATLTSSTLAPGSHSIVATYAGDGKASASVSTPLSLAVRQLTSVALASNSNPAQTLSPVILTASVTNSGVGKASGTITFTDGAVQLGTATLDVNGQATITVPLLSAGNHALVAAYAGDNTDFTSTSPALTEGVQLRPTSTTLTASQTDPANTQQVTLISVVRWTGTVTPTGTVTFISGSTVVGTTPVDATGVGTITINLQNGSESIVATYNGDTAYASSASQGTNITGGTATQFTMTLNPSALTIQSQQHSTVTLTIASIKGFNDMMQFGCLGLPASATCTFSKTQTALAANGSVTVQLTIDTGNPLGAGAETTSMNHTGSSVMLCFLPAGLLGGLALFKSRRRRPLLGFLLLVCAIATTMGVTGCAGLQVNGTPAGTYAIKVSASGTGSGVTQAQVMTLTVTQ